MVDGTVADPVLLISVTTTPPGPAGAANVTVPVEIEPPVTGLGVNVMPVIVPWPDPVPPGLTVKDAALALFTDRTIINALVVPVTDVALIGNVMDRCPSGTTTMDGTAAAPLSLVTSRKPPPEGAGSAMVTWPEATDPPLTVAGVIVNEVIVGLGPGPPPTIMNDPCPVTPLAFAVMLTEAGWETLDVNTWKPMLDWPAGIVTAGSTGKIETLELSET